MNVVAQFVIEEIAAVIGLVFLFLHTKRLNKLPSIMAEHSTKEPSHYWGLAFWVGLVFVIALAFTMVLGQGASFTSPVLGYLVAGFVVTQLPFWIRKIPHTRNLNEVGLLGGCIVMGMIWGFHILNVINLLVAAKLA